MTPEAIRRLRGDRTQAEFGELIGLDWRGVSYLENGKRQPSRPVLLHLERLAKQAQEQSQEKGDA